MVALGTLRRFLRYFRQLIAAGAFAAIVAAFSWFSIVPVLGARYTGNTLGRDEALGILALTLIVHLGAAPVAAAGLWYTVCEAQTGRTIRLQDYGRGIAAHWRPLFRYHLLLMAVWAVFGATAFSLMAAVPLPAVPLALLVGSLLSLTLGWYGPYLIVAERLGARAAAGQALRMLVVRPLNVLASLWLPALLWILVPLANRGTLGLMILRSCFLPFMALYLAERYRLLIKPGLRMPSQGGILHPPGPTIGL